MKCVYVLRSVDHPGQVYSGLTDDLRKRLKVHNAGGSPHTSKYKLPSTSRGSSSHMWLFRTRTKLLHSSAISNPGPAAHSRPSASDLLARGDACAAGGPGDAVGISAVVHCAPYIAVKTLLGDISRTVGRDLLTSRVGVGRARRAIVVDGGIAAEHCVWASRSSRHASSPHPCSRPCRARVSMPAARAFCLSICRQDACGDVSGNCQHKQELVRTRLRDGRLRNRGCTDVVAVSPRTSCDPATIATRQNRTIPIPCPAELTGTRKSGFERFHRRPDNSVGHGPST